MDKKYLTITALTKYIKYKFDNDIHLQDVLVEGEISNFKSHSTGHFYFTLKDQGSAITAMMFASSARNVKFRPTDGMKVFVTGNITVYEKTGNYQIVCKEMKSDGVGDLYLAYEQLKKELEEQGVFDQRYKKSITRFPKVIGVVTSPTGAAVRDVINTIKRRYPVCSVIVYPALVQGGGAKESIVSQIKLANEQKLCDTLIVGRGGGSIEDLWAFNEKIVAKAIFDSKIPIISAVGHEVDFTIADFVADMRAATPTAAAEIATPNLDTLKESVLLGVRRMNNSIKNYFSNYKMVLANLDKHLDSNNPKEKLEYKRNHIDNLKLNLDRLIQNIYNNKKHSYVLLNEKLKVLNPLSIMDKGYSIVKNQDKIIKSTKDVKIDDIIEVNLKDGIVKTKVVEVSNGR